MHSETRKIIRVGNSYAVTIPRAWLRYFGLTDRNHVQVISNDQIIIRPILERPHRSTVDHAEDSGRFEPRRGDGAAQEATVSVFVERAVPGGDVGNVSGLTGLNEERMGTCQAEDRS